MIIQTKRIELHFRRQVELSWDPLNLRKHREYPDKIFDLEDKKDIEKIYEKHNFYSAVEQYEMIVPVAGLYYHEDAHRIYLEWKKRRFTKKGVSY